MSLKHEFDPTGERNAEKVLFPANYTKCLIPASICEEFIIYHRIIKRVFNCGSCFSRKTQIFSSFFTRWRRERGRRAQKPLVEMVALVTGLTLIPPALLFTLEVSRLLHGERAPIIHSGDEIGTSDWGKESPNVLSRHRNNIQDGVFLHSADGAPPCQRRKCRANTVFKDVSSIFVHVSDWDTKQEINKNKDLKKRTWKVFGALWPSVGHKAGQSDLFVPWCF